MKELPKEIIQFLREQNFVIISTIDEDGAIDNSCKGIVDIDKDGRVYLLDLYLNRTFKNLKNNPHISITAVDEDKFKGYSLKGKAKIIPREELSPEILNTWEDKITSRASQRVVKNIREGKVHPRHPEALLPKPTYMVVIEIEEVIDLTPRHIKEGV